MSIVSNSPFPFVAPLTRLTGIGYYSDATPDVAFTYDRLGNMVSVTDAGGTRVFTRDPDGQTLSDTLSALGQEFVLLESYDTFGRSTGYAVSNTLRACSGLFLRPAYGSK